jgi:hypothetical protein
VIVLAMAVPAMAQDSQEFNVLWDAPTTYTPTRYELFVTAVGIEHDTDNPTKTIQGDVTGTSFWIDVNQMFKVVVRACVDNNCSGFSNELVLGTLVWNNANLRLE